MSPGATMPSAAPQSSNLTPHAPIQNFSTQDHFHPSIEQQPTQPTGRPITSTPTAPPSAPPQPEHVSPEQAFSFIMNPEQQPSKSQLPGSNSMILRILVVLGGLLVLVIIFAVLKNLLGGTSNLGSFVSVIQDQQELVHLTTNVTGNQQLALPTDDQNFAATAQLSLTSSQSGLTSYLASIGMKKIN